MTDSQEYAKWFGDTVAGIREVKLFGIYKEKHNEFFIKCNKVIGTQKKMNMVGLVNVLSDRMLVQLLTITYLEKIGLAILEIIKDNYAIVEYSGKLIVKLGICFPSRKVYFS